MGRVVPETQQDRILFYKTRIDDWTANAAALGLDPVLLAQLQTMIDEADQAYDERSALVQAAKAATENLALKIGEMHELGSALIQAVRAQAATTADIGLYPLALLDAPQQPSPVHPETPHSLTYRINFGGHLRLSWKGSAKGGYFTVHRMLDGQGGFKLIGVTGDKKFIDSDFPEGSRTAAYQVYAHKGGRTSEGSTAVSAVFLPVRIVA